MKRFFKRAAGLLLAAATLSPAALASDVLGDRLYSYDLAICAGTTLTRQVLWSAAQAGPQTENYVTYTPSAAVSPRVSYGDSVLSRETVYSMAKDLEGQGERVLSGINGDYFVMASGDPLGIVITDGVLRSSASYLSAIGFLADGTAVAGKPDLKLRANFSDYSLKIAEINKVRSGDGYFLFTEDFGPNTRNTREGIDVILAPTGKTGQKVSDADKTTTLLTSDTLGVGKVVPCVVEEVIDAAGATEIPRGKFVLSIADGGGDWLVEQLAALRPGDKVDIEVSSPDPKWNDVVCAVGSLHHILSQGQATGDQETGASPAPRTAVGVKPDGSVIFYTIDGRQAGYSQGATSLQVAQRLAELGCSEGMLMDGGGSTSFVSTYPDRNEASAINQPSDGSPRAVTNAIFLVSNLSATGVPGSLYVTPRDLVLLAGASTQCAVTALDTGWRPQAGLPGQVTWSASGGQISPEGVFTAPAQPGVCTITAQCGDISGSGTVTVYDTPDAIRLTDAATGKTLSSLTLVPGQRVDVNASATYHSVPLTATDACFTWSTDVGSVDANGVLTAGTYTANGRLTIQAGGHTASIPVSVSASPRVRLLADFEDTGVRAEDLYFANATGTRRDFGFSSQRKCGYRSLRWDYAPENRAATLTLAEPIPLTDADRFLAFWVYGDNSGNTLFGLFPRENGSLAAQTTTLNFTGWKRITFLTPNDAMAFSGFKVMGDKSGTLFLDQLALSNQMEEDKTAPSVSLTVNGTAVSAKLGDNTAASLSPRQITLAMDGVKLPFTYSGGVLTATLPEPGNSSHQISLTASDACGNLGGATKLIVGSAACPFSDMKNHWAAPYVTRLHELGIVSGMGNGTFAPGRAITRGDFALLLARWLGVDLEVHQDAILPFADAAKIPSWDRAAVSALYQMGIMRGSAGKNGTVYANATSSLTRSEAFTLLARTQALGWPEASLSGFSDAKSLPSWARSATATLVGRKIVSGSYGKLRPKDSVSRAEVAKLLMSAW